MWYLASTASAHDYWLEAQPAFTEAPASVTLRLFLGEGGVPEEEKAHLTARTVAFVHHTAGGSAPLSPEDGAIPVFSGPLASGGHLFALERGLAWIELEPDKFDAYLESEGLLDALRDRRAAGEHDRPGREQYARFLKVFVPVGAKPDPVVTRPVGHAFEIVLREPPVAGVALRVGLRVGGEPLADHPVTAHVRRADAPDVVASQTVRTDAKGNAEFPSAAAGTWLLRSVSMTRCSGCERADWSSQWAAYTFPVLHPPPPRACGCRTIGPDGGWALVLSAILLRRRRRGSA